MKCKRLNRPSLQTIHQGARSSRPPAAKRTITVSAGPEPHAEGRFAVWVHKARQVPEVRRELVDRVREEIRRGEYETPRRLEVAIERLLEDLTAA